MMGSGVIRHWTVKILSTRFNVHKTTSLGNYLNRIRGRGSGEKKKILSTRFNVHETRYLYRVKGGILGKMEISFTSFDIYKVPFLGLKTRNPRGILFTIFNVHETTSLGLEGGDFHYRGGTLPEFQRL